MPPVASGIGSRAGPRRSGLRHGSPASFRLGPRNPKLHIFGQHLHILCSFPFVVGKHPALLWLCSLVFVVGQQSGQLCVSQSQLLNQLGTHWRHRVTRRV
jgi:hypothetical protein